MTFHTNTQTHTHTYIYTHVYMCIYTHIYVNIELTTQTLNNKVIKRVYPANTITALNHRCAQRVCLGRVKG